MRKEWGSAIWDPMHSSLRNDAACGDLRPLAFDRTQKILDRVTAIAHKQRWPRKYGATLTKMDLASNQAASAVFAVLSPKSGGGEELAVEATRVHKERIGRWMRESPAAVTHKDIASLLFAILNGRGDFWRNSVFHICPSSLTEKSGNQVESHDCSGPGAPCSNECSMCCLK